MGRSRFLPVVVSARGSGPGRRGEPDRRTGHAGAGGRRKRRRFAARQGDDRRSARRPWRIIPGPAHPGCNDSGMSCDNIVSRTWHPRPGRAAEPGHAGIRFMAQAEGEACRLSPAGADLRGGRDGRRPACSALRIRIQTRPVGAGEGSGCPEMAVVRRHSGQRLAKHAVRASTWRPCTARQRGAHSGRASKALGKRARTSGAAPPSPKNRRNPARGRRRRRRAGGGVVTAPMPPSTSTRPAASRRPALGGAGLSIPFHSPCGDSPQPDWPEMHTKGSWVAF
ncbi:hypothetical protein ATH84_10533 [Paracoccus versutus]|uniref:Uncharacterized protein n=1 Tax=Paracoccus versutus TaxID=34007 RepID=A0AAQ0HDE2_PARVE|nr:hypothetical protein ATH84_10533 [Paracoccus versutus]